MKIKNCREDVIEALDPLDEVLMGEHEAREEFLSSLPDDNWDDVTEWFDDNEGYDEPRDFVGEGSITIGSKSPVVFGSSRYGFDEFLPCCLKKNMGIEWLDEWGGVPLSTREEASNKMLAVLVSRW